MHLAAMVLNFRLYSKAVSFSNVSHFFKRKLDTTEWLMILSVESYSSVFARLRIAAEVTQFLPYSDLVCCLYSG